MKKTRIIATAVTVCIAASMIAGCNHPTGDAQATKIEGGQTQISVETSGENQSIVDAYKFSYKGYDIVPGTPIAPVLEALGEPKDQRRDASCAGEGFDIIYMYEGFEIHTYEEGDETINGICISDALIDVGGVHVGDALDAAKKVYGDPAPQSDDYTLFYIAGNTVLMFNTDGFGTITEIWFMEKTAAGA